MTIEVSPEKRNVIDYFKHNKTLEIKSMLDTERNEFAVAMLGFNYDFNVGTVVRNANAMLAKEVFFVGEGRNKWDRRGALGTQHYSNITRIKRVDDFLARVREDRYRLVVMEDTPEAKNLSEYEWEEKSCILIGAENEGVDERVLSAVKSGEIPGDIVYIPMLGSVRSLNAGTASGIAMYDYVAKVITKVPAWAER